MVAGQHGFGELPPMGLEDGGPVAEDVEGDSSARCDAVVGVDRIVSACYRTPDMGETETEVDIEAVHNLPGVLHEFFQPGILCFGIITLVLIGEVVSSIAVAYIIHVIDAVGSGVAVAVSDLGVLEFRAEFKVVVAAYKIFSVVGQVRVGLVPIPVGVEEPSGAVVPHVVIEVIVGADVAGHGIEIVISRKKGAFHIEKGSLAEDLGEAETAHDFRRFLFDRRF